MAENILNYPHILTIFSNKFSLVSEVRVFFHTAQEYTQKVVWHLHFTGSIQTSIVRKITIKLYGTKKKQSNGIQSLHSDERKTPAVS